MKKRILLFLLTAQSTFAQIPVAELNQRFENFKTKNNLSSVSYAVVHKGKIVAENYSGIINHEKNLQANKESVYRIASMSKSFAGMAILQLRDQNKLNLDDPVTKYITELKDQRFSEHSAPITLKHLLIHAAGFPEDNPWGDRQLGISTSDFLKMLENGISFSNEPGVSYEYSNMAFAMLGHIIDKVSGQPYQQFIQNNIWKPLGMNNTYWQYTDVPETKLARGYRFVKNEFVPQPIENDGAYGIMGGILTSTEDFVKYMNFHQSAYTNYTHHEQVLKKSSLKEMHFASNFNSWNKRGFKKDGTPCDNLSFYGYGLRIDKNCENITMIGHSGGLPGYGSDWKFVPDYDLAIVTLSNGTYGSAALMNNEILPFIIEKANLLPKEFPVSDILQQRQNELLDFLPNWKNAKESNIFAINFFDDYYIDMLQEDCKKHFEKIGKIIKIHPMKAENALRGKFMIEGEKGNCQISFTLSPEKPAKIQAFQIF